MAVFPSKPDEVIYVAGPMTGLPDFNFPAFHSMSARLRELGFIVLSPAEHNHGFGKPWQFYMREALSLLLKCDSVIMLEGWNNSKGAKLEWHIAQALQMKIRHESEMR